MTEIPKHLFCCTTDKLSKSLYKKMQMFIVERTEKKSVHPLVQHCLENREESIHTNA
jgi:hypothetical protein